MSFNKALLIILDGFGIRTEQAHNAIAKAKTPNIDAIINRAKAHNLYAEIETSGAAVGLPHGQMGNSEIGHLTIGSGRVVYDGLPRINNAIADGEFANNANYKSLKKHLLATGGVCHLFALISDGGVHSHINHMIYVAKDLAKANISVALHCQTDGRDVPPKSAPVYLRQIQEELIEKFSSNFNDADGDGANANITIATISGRYYSMDRDKKWQRTKLAEAAITRAEGPKFASVMEYVEEAHKNGQTDEFIVPAVHNDYKGIDPVKDAIFIINFRPDRIKQIATMFESAKSSVAKPQNDAELHKNNKASEISSAGGIDKTLKLSMAHISDKVKMPVMFPPVSPDNTLSQIIADAGLRQLHMAETEKYAHVTFFFNGGREAALQGEDRILIPSPDVPTYDLKPEMSAKLLTENLINIIEGKTSKDGVNDKEDKAKEKAYNFIVVNYANPDMVGHTGNEQATIKAIEYLDGCLAKLTKSGEESGYNIIITADHGNAEKMLDDEGNPHTQHTTGPVPLVMIACKSKNHRQKQKMQEIIQNLPEPANLAVIAPAILQIIGLPVPQEMMLKT